MEIYLSLMKDGDIKDVLVADGIGDKVVGLKIIEQGKYYFIEPIIHGKIRVRTLNGRMIVNPLSENSILLDKEK